MDCKDLREPEAVTEVRTVPGRILAAVSDLFFVAKIDAAARQTGAPVEFFSNGQLLQKSLGNAPGLVIVDLNNSALEPIALIQAIRESATTRGTQVIGFVSHVQHERKREAEQAGCDLVLPRSVFSQNLNELLRRRSCHL